MAKIPQNPEFLAKLDEVEQLLYDGLIKDLKVGKFPKKTKKLFFQIYTYIDNYSDRNTDAPIYELFKKIITEFAVETAYQIRRKFKIEILDDFLELSKRMDYLLNFMLKSFSFLDISIYSCLKDVKKLRELAIDIYKYNLFMPFQNQLTDEVNQLLKDDIGGNKKHRDKIKRVLKIMRDMDLDIKKVTEKKKENKSEKNEENIEDRKPTPIQDYWYNLYKEIFELFVNDKAQKDIKNKSTPEYVFEELNFIKEEKERQAELINERYYGELNNIMYEKLIGKNMVELVNKNSGVKYMLENDKLEELRNLYELFKLYPQSFEEISKILEDYIQKNGEALKENQEIKKEPQKIIPKLLELYNKINDIVKNCFKNDILFQNTQIIGFKHFMKKDFYAKQLANYIDYCLRWGFKGKKEEDINKILTDIIALIKYLESNFVFQKESEKIMGERLLKEQSLSMNYEIEFVKKLIEDKNSPQLEFFSKMKKMLEDLDKSKKLTQEYKEFKNKENPNGINLSVKILDGIIWEMNKMNLIKFKLPNFLESCIKDFQKFFSNKMKSEIKFYWYHTYSKVEIQYLYLKKNYISISTLPQILILLALEKSGQLSIKQLAEECGIETTLIKDNIQGLIFNQSFNKEGNIEKGVIIPIKNETKDFTDDDEFKINENFISPSLKFNTFPATKKKSQQELAKEGEMTEEQEKKYKKNLLEANITRIMKSRAGNSISHADLIKITHDQMRQSFSLTFQPNEIKEMIEKLIEKKIIQRDPNNRGFYQYLA